MEFITSFGPVIAAGVEGTGTYGAELARTLTQDGIQVREVMRPNRQGRRLRGKPDSLDAYQTAESVLADRGTAIPKARNGAVESLRVLRAERNSAMRARVAIMTQFQSVLVAAPEQLRARYRGLAAASMMAVLEKARPSGDLSEPVNATAIVLKRLAIRYRHLDQERALIDAELDALITVHAPMIRDLQGVGTEVGSQLHPRRYDGRAGAWIRAGWPPTPSPRRRGSSSRPSGGTGLNGRRQVATSGLTLGLTASDRRLTGAAMEGTDVVISPSR